jgi:hypothetical protein
VPLPFNIQKMCCARSEALDGARRHGVHAKGIVLDMGGRVTEMKFPLWSRHGFATAR